MVIECADEEDICVSVAVAVNVGEHGNTLFKFMRNKIFFLMDRSPFAPRDDSAQGFNRLFPTDPPPTGLPPRK